VRKSVFLVALVLAVTTACIPPPSTHYQPCENVTAAPFRCSIQHRVDPTAHVTTFVAAASTSEPPTGIKFHVILEQKVPDPSDPRGFRYVQQWQDFKTSSAQVQAFQWGDDVIQAPWIGCVPGIYRWHLEVIFFSAQNTTFTSNTADFAV
jgi:hypothetical protein